MAVESNGRDVGGGSATGEASPPSGAPTDLLVASSVGDRCVNCGAVLSSDQRYCVVCGERRGAPRFSLPPATTESSAPAGETRTTITRRRMASGGGGFGTGLTLIAGVGTLLLAMLVGVLIGHNTANTRTVTSTPPVKIVTVNTGGGSSSSSGSTGSTGATGSTSGTKTHKSAAKAKKSTPKAAAKTAKQQASAAKKVLGGKGTAAPTTKVGSKCSGSACSQPGYNKKTKKFDGSFFGG